MKKPILVGITGGIGSGKSLVASIFHVLGVPIYNAKNTRLVIAQCMGLTEYLSALTGVVMSQEKVRDMYLLTANSESYSKYLFNVAKKFGARIQISLFQGYNERVSGAIGAFIGKINKIL